jgi:DNA polymerase III delta subunit
VAETLKLKPNQTFLIRKYGQQASYFKTEELEEIIEQLINLDENSKNGNIDLDIGLESILCRYC